MKKVVTFFVVLIACTAVSYASSDSILIKATNLELDPFWDVVDANASNDTYSVVIRVKDRSFRHDAVGDFDLTDFEDGSCLVNHVTGDTVALTEAEIAIRLAGEYYTITGWMKGTEAAVENVYKLDLSYVLPNPTREITLSMSDLTFYNACNSQGVWQAFGGTEDKYVSLSAYASELTGTYGFKQLYLDYCVYAEVQGADSVLYGLVAADIEVKMQEKAAVITGDILCMNTMDDTDLPLIHLNLTCPTVIDADLELHLEHDEQEQAADMYFTAKDITIHTETIEEGEVSLTADNGSELCALLFLVHGTTVENPIPEGVYFINESEKSGTVLASSGVSEAGGITYSCAVEYDGKYIDRVWWFQEGTVRVSHNMYGEMVIEVDALNSYSVPVHVLMEFVDNQGVEEVNSISGATKRLENGCVVIERGDVRYDILGARLL